LLRAEHQCLEVVDESLEDARQVSLEALAERAGLVEQEPRRGGVLGEERKGRPHRGAQHTGLVGARGLDDGVADATAQALLLVGHEGVEQLVLGGEVPVDDAVGEVGAPRDVGHRRVVEPPGGEQRLRRVEDLGAP